MNFLINSKFWKYFIPLFLMASFGILIGLVKVSNNSVIVESNDKMLIKESFENLNGKVNDNNISYVDVSLDSNNSYVYISQEEIKNLLTNGSGVLFLGSYTDNEARNMVSVLNEALMSTSISKIFYYDISKIKSKIVVVNDEIEIDKGEDFYYYLLERLDAYLPDYYLINSKGNEIKASEKRISDATILYINEGNIVAYRFGISDLVDNVNQVLNDEDKNNLLKSILVDLGKVVEECNSSC